MKKIRFSLSGAELRLYLAEKYNLTEKDCKNFRIQYFKKVLRVAFYEMDAQLSAKAKANIKDSALNKAE